MTVYSLTVELFAKRLLAIRGFHDSFFRSKWNSEKSQAAWLKVHEVVDITMPRTIPDQNGITDFYHKGVEIVRGVLDDMLKKLKSSPPHITQVRVPEMDPVSLLHNANRLLISYGPVFGYCHSIACFLYERLREERIANQSFMTSAIMYLAHDSIDDKIVAQMSSFARAAELPVTDIRLKPEEIDAHTRHRLELVGASSVKDTFAREFDTWIKYLCFLGMGNRRLAEQSRQLLPRFALIFAADHGVLSEEFLLSMNALSEHMRK